MWRRITAALLTLLVLVAHQIPANAVPVAISPTPNSDALVPHVVPTLPNLGLLPVVHLERRQTAGTLYYDFNTSFVNLNFANVLAASPRPSNLPTSSQLPTEDQLKETASATKASASLGSFTAWINGAATWRKSLRGAWTYTGPNSIPQSSSQYGTFITSNFLGLVIFVGFCIVVAVLGLVLSPCCCCCFVCRKPKARDGNRFTFLRITVLIAFIMQLVFCVSMFIGTGTLSKGVSMTLGSSLSTITNVQILNYNLNPVLVNTLPLVSNGVSAVVSGMTDPSFITTWVSSTLQPSGSQLSTDLNTAQTRLTTAKTALTGLQVSVPALVSDVNSLQTSINALIPAANALNSQQTVPTTNEQYTLASSISVPAANSVALPTVASPPTSAISSALSTIEHRQHPAANSDWKRRHSGHQHGQLHDGRPPEWVGHRPGLSGHFARAPASLGDRWTGVVVLGVGQLRRHRVRGSAAARVLGDGDLGGGQARRQCGPVLRMLQLAAGVPAVLAHDYLRGADHGHCRGVQRAPGPETHVSGRAGNQHAPDPRIHHHGAQDPGHVRVQPGRIHFHRAQQRRRGNGAGRPGHHFHV
ncbi:hypothetical protein BC828DRAFT_168520 [Blastocladiella britannica]|nr:hypothetical protein BC828DRAFT_168520 [Blastocladiella britannica]